MAPRDRDQDVLAAERALGLETARRESRGERRAREDWEERFAPLAEAMPSVPPPAGLFAAIEARIDGEETVADLASARRRAARWRSGALLTGALAAGLAAFVVLDRTGRLEGLPEPAPNRYVAVVTSDADPDRPGMIVQFDIASGVATVVPVLGAPPEGRSYEMWHLREGAERPYSLGLLPDEPALSQVVNARPGDTVAISLEPMGGSPTGQPTLPLFHGRIVAVGE